jgi:LysM repeat protein
VSGLTTTQPRVVLDLCPYLSTIDGNWRSSSAVREHRCIAVAPPVPLALEKQRRLCLVADHTACATYGAAEAARPAQPPRPDGHIRTIARTTPVVIDQRRFDIRLPASRPDRISGQAVLVAVLGLAFAAIVIARPVGSAPGTGAPSGFAASNAPAPSAAASVTPTPHPSAAPSSAPVVTARPVGSPAPSGAAQATNPPASPPPAGSGATYKVKSGDTLTAIAARYGTTVKILMTLNGITDPSKLRVGQILKLP